MRLDWLLAKTRDWWACGSFPAALPLLVLLLLVLSGCGNSTPPDTVPIIKALLAAAALSAAKTKAGPAARHYVERRVLYLIGKNSGWATESGFTSLTARIGAEMNQVAAFVDERLTTLGGTDPVNPQHRDLQDAAKQLTTAGPSDVSTQFQKNKSERTERISQITWRACAIQAELWSGGDSTLAPVLQKPGLTEILDRRLHSVEMLILHDEGNLGKWSVATSASGWKDQQRTSLFQYPWVRLQDDADFPSALTTAGLTVAGLAPNWKNLVSEIDYKVRARPRPATAANWVWTDPPFQLALVAGATGSAAMEAMIPTAPKTDPAFEDFWERNWMFCDIMLAALHVQGLRFGRLRRTGTDNDFNTAAAAGITLQPLIPGTGPPKINLLMANAAQWFEAVAIPHDELQVGDHIVYWNNRFVRFILHSPFGLENSYVTRVGSDGHTLMLAGHGMQESTESKFTEKMAEDLADALGGIRAAINRHQGEHPPPDILQITSPMAQFLAVNWAPFGELFGPANPDVKLRTDGAWWIRILLDELHDRGDPVPSMTEALAMIPKSVRVDLAKGMQPPNLPPGTHQSNYQESIYFPLSLPEGAPGGWPTYLDHSKPGEAVVLVDLIPDGSMIPGFYFKGRSQQSTIPVLRPKVQI